MAGANERHALSGDKPYQSGSETLLRYLIEQPSYSEPTPTNTGFRRDLSVSYERLGDVMVAAGNGADAERFFRDSLTIAEHLAATDPTNTAFQRDVAVSYERIGEVAAGDRNNEAAGAFEASLVIWRRLAGIDPTAIDYRVAQRVPLTRLAALCADADLRQACDYMTQALDLIAATASEQSDVPDRRASLERAVNQATQLLASENAVDANTTSPTAALARARQTLAAHPPPPD
jgi:hypothetical protein